MVFAAAALSLAGLQACAPGAPERTSNIVRRIDHVLIASSESSTLFEQLAQTLRLPVAWPMADHDGFASGGVFFGNVNVEVLRAPASSDGSRPSRWTGFALEPEPLAASLRELDARAVRHGAPAPFRTGLFTTKWTTVALPEVSSDAVEVFLCEFGSDPSEQRRRSSEELRARDGGALSVRSVRELVYGAVDAVAMRESWSKLLAPAIPTADGLWMIGDGAALRVVSADRDGLRALVVEVESFEQAREFAREHALLGPERADSFTLSSPALDGLDITIVEGPRDGER